MRFLSLLSDFCHNASNESSECFLALTINSLSCYKSFNMKRVLFEKWQKMLLYEYCSHSSNDLNMWPLFKSPEQELSNDVYLITVRLKLREYDAIEKSKILGGQNFCPGVYKSSLRLVFLSKNRVSTVYFLNDHVCNHHIFLCVEISSCFTADAVMERHRTSKNDIRRLISRKLQTEAKLASRSSRRVSENDQWPTLKFVNKIYGL